MNRIKHWINGHEVDSPESFETINPATMETICKVASGGAEEINLAVAAAKPPFLNGLRHPLKSAPVLCGTLVN